MTVLIYNQKLNFGFLSSVGFSPAVFQWLLSSKLIIVNCSKMSSAFSPSKWANHL